VGGRELTRPHLNRRKLGMVTGLCHPSYLKNRRIVIQGKKHDFYLKITITK
jgi:hypothetical protein